MFRKFLILPQQPVANPITEAKITENEHQTKAAVTLQKHVRGFLARKKYAIKPLEEKQLKDFEAFAIGNDPVMPKELANYREPHDKIALIGTSGFRALSLACKIGHNKNIPKIIIVDNSRQVYELWYALREFAADKSKAGTMALFLENLPTFLAEHQHLYRLFSADEYAEDAKPGTRYLNQDPNVYFNALFRRYGFDYAKKVILHTSLIKQSWTDEDTFTKLRHILTYQDIDNIYMYPSNILFGLGSCQKRHQLLKNIEDMNPKLSIHTDCSELTHLPEKVYLFENQNPRLVKQSLFQSKPNAKHESADLDLTIPLENLSRLLTCLKRLSSQSEAREPLVLKNQCR